MDKIPQKCAEDLRGSHCEATVKRGHRVKEDNCRKKDIEFGESYCV